MPTKTHVVRSKIECIVECKNTPSCLSFLFNGDLKKCYLYDRDFVDATVTSTTDEIGWNYFYVLPGVVIDKSKCELPAIGICQNFCFFYRNGFYYDTAQDFIQECTDTGSEVIKVYRYLKQYCMEQAVDQVIGEDVIALNGIQEEATGDWRYFDGTNITYFYWDVEYSQPGYVSPTTTPGKYEGYIATHKYYNYRWHDGFDWWVTAVLCEII